MIRYRIHSIHSIKNLTIPGVGTERAVGSRCLFREDETRRDRRSPPQQQSSAVTAGSFRRRLLTVPFGGGQHSAQ